MWFIQSSKNFNITGRKKKSRHENLDDEVALVGYKRTNEGQVDHNNNQVNCDVNFSLGSRVCSGTSGNPQYLEMTVSKASSQSSLVQSLSEVISEAKQELLKENLSSDDDYEEIGNCDLYYRN